MGSNRELRESLQGARPPGHIPSEVSPTVFDGTRHSKTWPNTCTLRHFRMGDAPLGFRKHDTLTPVSTSYLNWVDSNTSRSRRRNTLPGVVGICHTSGSDASRDTSGFTAVFTPRSANDRHALRSLTVKIARDSPGTLWDLRDLPSDTAKVGCEVGPERSTSCTKGYRLKGARPGIYSGKRAGPSASHPIKSRLSLMSLPVLVAPPQ